MILQSTLGLGACPSFHWHTSLYGLKQAICLLCTSVSSTLKWGQEFHSMRLVDKV